MLAKSVFLQIYRSSFITKMAQNVAANTQLAQRVQNNVVNENYSVQHQAKIRQRANIQSTISNLQRQLREQIAKSLKKSQSKVIYLIEKAKKSYQKGIRNNLTDIQKIQHNKLITDCQKARWQFIVHRQSIGFTIKNYQLITSMYVIPDRL